MNEVGCRIQTFDLPADDQLSFRWHEVQNMVLKVGLLVGFALVAGHCLFSCLGGAMDRQITTLVHELRPLL